MSDLAGDYFESKYNEGLAKIDTLEYENSRLRAEVDRFKSGDVYRKGLEDGEAHASFQLGVELDKWKHRAERYREALKEIVNNSGSRLAVNKKLGVSISYSLLNAVEIAKSALSESGEGGG